MDNKDVSEKNKDNPEKKVIATEPKKKKPRCHFCSKKLKMTELNFKCKCGPNFCLQHVSPHSHNCSYNYLKDKYGDWILYQPEFNKNTYFLWLLPILMFVIGGAILFKLFIMRKN